MFLVSHQIVCECCLILHLKRIKITPILLPKVLPETRQRTLKSPWTPGELTAPTQTPQLLQRVRCAGSPRMQRFALFRAPLNSFGPGPRGAQNRHWFEVYSYIDYNKIIIKKIKNWGCGRNSKYVHFGLKRLTSLNRERKPSRLDLQLRDMRKI